MSTRIATAIVAHVRSLVAVMLVVTAALAVPLLTMAPTSSASPEPDGPVFTARDSIDERFEIEVFGTFVILEADDGDILDPAVLAAIAATGEALRSDPVIGDLLLTRFDPTAGRETDGFVTIADIVDEALSQQGTSLADASAPTVTAAVNKVVDAIGPQALGLSIDSARGPDGNWTAAALTTNVSVGNEALGGGSTSIAVGSDDTAKEEISRDIVEILDGADGVTAYGVANDVNLTAAEEGEAAGPFIGLTIVGVLAIVGLTFRSYWAVSVTAAALSALVVWLRGASNLVGLENDQILDTIVPIALISFGIDFAFHAVGRYREVQEGGHAPLQAVTAGLGAVLAALGLALASDAVAFLSNSAAGIESIVQFGIAATLGLCAAFILLGLVAPVVIAHAESRAGRTPTTRRGRVLAVAGSVGAAMTAMASVLLTVFLSPPMGLVLLVLGIALVAVPLAVAGRRAGASGRRSVSQPTQPSSLARGLGATSAWLAKRGRVVLPVTLLVTAVLGVYAVQIPTEFDVRDFFSADTSFVVGLDKLDTYVGEQGGEPGQVLVEGDLSTVEGLMALRSFTDDVQGLDTDRLGRDDAGRVDIEAGVLDVVDATMSSEVARARVVESTGVTVTDDDGDGLPDTDDQVTAVLTTASEQGVAFDETTTALTAGQVGEVLDLAQGATLDATVLTLSLPGSRAVENIVAAGEALSVPVNGLSESLGATGSATVTGSPFVRQGGLDAITRSLLLSLPIAVLACFAIGAAFMRSIRYGAIAVVPILLVVAWLYGLMERTGFAINLVTGTIGAVSIGIGIDYAIHYIMRFREEHADIGDRLEALRRTGEGTGVALVGSAASSVVGFAILAFAPMPLFASYGLLTAVMIAMALAGTLTVLPCLLYLSTDDEPTAPPRATERRSSVPAVPVA